MTCQLFTLDLSCDLPNWVALSIGGIIGLCISVYLFLHTKFEKRKRTRDALVRLANDYDMLEDQFSVLESGEKEYQQLLAEPDKHNHHIKQHNRYWRQKTFYNLKGWSDKIQKHIEISINDLDHGLKEITEYLILGITVLEETLNDDTRYPDVLSEALERNTNYNRLFSSIKPNPRKLWGSTLDSWDDKDGTWTSEQEMNYLFYGKNKS